MKRTSQEIAAEIAALKQLLETVPQFSGFGDDHHAAMRAQIEVLEADESTFEQRQLLEPEFVREAAHEAADWKSGELFDAAEPADSPSTDWNTLL